MTWPVSFRADPMFLKLDQTGWSNPVEPEGPEPHVIWFKQNRMPLIELCEHCSSTFELFKLI